MANRIKVIIVCVVYDVNIPTPTVSSPQVLRVRLDTTAPQATAITATTVGSYVISPYGRSGTPITYAVSTDEDVVYGEIVRPDTYTRVFDTPSGSLKEFSATFAMMKRSDEGSSLTDREGYFSPKLTLIDLAGNVSEYDAAVCAGGTGGSSSPLAACSSLPAASRDFRDAELRTHRVWS